MRHGCRVEADCYRKNSFLRLPHLRQIDLQRTAFLLRFMVKPLAYRTPTAGSPAAVAAPAWMGGMESVWPAVRPDARVAAV